MLKRFFVGLAIIIIVGLALMLGGWYMTGFVVLLSLISQYEITYAANQKEPKVFAALNYCAAILVTPVLYFFELNGMLALIVIYLIILCVYTVLAGGHSLQSLKKTMFSFFYPQLFFMFLIALTFLEPNTSRFLFILIILSAAVTDIFALFAGKLFGKHKLCPAISPKKTVEGAIGGFVFGLIAVCCFGYFAQQFFLKEYTLLEYILTGAVLCVMAQFGDLIASVIKRDYAIKDFGNILPGHGGILDRLDSILFVAPIVFYFFMY